MIMWENVRYVKGMTGEVACINADRNGWHLSIPIDENNADYIAIMALVDAGELTIAPAEDQP
jgi:hypothetical protein